MIELQLPDMTCGHCVRTVSEVARRLDPSAQVQADLNTHTVRFDTKADEQILRAALEEEGYPASN
jgi:copper chaperone